MENTKEPNERMENDNWLERKKEYLEEEVESAKKILFFSQREVVKARRKLKEFLEEYK